MENHVISYGDWPGTTSTGSVNSTFTWLTRSWTPPEDEPPAGVLARPRPAPPAPPAAAMVFT